MTTRIVGIALVQNEENFVSWALGNVIDFCDELLVLDNRSRDGTWPALEQLAAANPKIRLQREPNALRSNAHLQPYLGQDVWVFGIDGDEIYDRDGLLRLRARLLAGEFANHWRIVGHTLNATQVDFAAGEGTGYASPEAASPTKLYNFSQLASWHVNTQRLHGRPQFLPGFEPESTADLHDSGSWNDCDFRCLHLCFFPRSGHDEEVEVRRNITDKSFRNVVRRPIFGLLKLLGLERGRLGAYLAPRRQIKKMVRYRRGRLVTLPLGASFGRPPADPGGKLEAMIRRISLRRASDPDAGMPVD
ncbi:hypothetical protein [Devosia sp.]|uniref:hypothetical protein n=1 Tax=Devosia sp. TaxID=1871048 RepID=UPI003A900911